MIGNKSSFVIYIDDEDDYVGKKSRKQSETGKFSQEHFSVIHIDDDHDDEPKRLVNACAANKPRNITYNEITIIDSDSDDNFSSKMQKRERKMPTDENYSTKKQNVSKKEIAKCLCIICLEEKYPSNMFSSGKCNHHSFCKDCISKHVTSKVQENIVKVKCPDMKCDAILEPENCRSVVLPNVLDRWEMVRCESLIPESEKYYCPYNDCSALLIKDGCGRLKQTECPHCRKQFCAQCNVPWHVLHEKHTCKKFKEMMKSMNDRQTDEFLVKYAEKRGWQRCPSCRFYVEKVSGCSYIRCRCGNSFIFLPYRDRTDV